LDGIELKAVDPTDEEPRNADCVLILADHAEFDDHAVARSARLIVDTRNSAPRTPSPRGRVVTL
jgi:UDP-N-acetyl-D-mannosaminuronate dehydrogenase